MGQGGYINLINGSPYAWQQTYKHSYQMNAWGFPSTVASGKVQTVYVEWDEAHTTKDDAGEVTYTISNPTSSSFQIQARATSGFMLQNWFSNLMTQNNAVGSTLKFGWKHDGYVNFILSGSENDFSSSNPPVSWMQKNIGSLGPRTLRHITIPGSHDAGMSVRTGGTAGSFPCNTLTQTNSIAGQLNAGARYFDIRPVISAGEYYTGHYSKIGDSWQGGNGQKISEIIAQVNAFTSANRELVILNLSHDLNTDNGNDNYTPFTQKEWDNLFTQLNTTSNLFVAPGDPTTVDLTTLSLNQFIGGNRAAVVMIVEPTSPSLGAFSRAGFYRYAQFNAYNSYSNTNDKNTMINDQLSKMRSVRSNPDGQYFILSWTLTQDAEDVVGCLIEVAPSIVDLGLEANPQMFAQLLNSVTKSTYPNVLYIDSIDSSDVTALAMAINNYINS
ncbi:PLC-like phosphodiesterase [Collybia nuda]|uniref:PLC-like phosphodiesterase n=1 Tax=Collybia nuda TaxID=64659 RepID=A0A9P5XZE6_9AGAR|nr:PLC-like phosphodiesterase [Collybia nuda]